MSDQKTDHAVDQYPYAGIIKGKIVDRLKYDFYFSDDRIRELFTQNTKTINGESIFGSGNIVINDIDAPLSSIKLHDIHFYNNLGEVGYLGVSLTGNLELGANVLNIDANTFSLGSSSIIEGNDDYISISSKELKWTEQDVVQSISVERDSYDYSYVGWNGKYFQWTNSLGQSFYTVHRNPDLNDKVYAKNGNVYTEYKYDIDKRLTQPSIEYLFSDALAKTDNIFTKTSQLENDAEFVSKSYIDLRDDQIADLYKKLTLKADAGSIPSKTSQLTNDSGFITKKDVPSTLKNPYPISWTTGSTKNMTSGSYDGSQKVSFIIPTKYSDLSPDITYLTHHQSLVGYAKITDIPSTLKNPYTLSWIGYSTGTYDGSAEAEIKIPSKVTDLSDGNQYPTKKYVDDQDATKVGYVIYDENKKKIFFRSSEESSENIGEIDARPFIKDGMLEGVKVIGSDIVITFNTDAGKDVIKLPIADIFKANDFNIDDYYTKKSVDDLLSKKIDTVDVTGEGNAITGASIDPTNKNRLILDKNNSFALNDHTHKQLKWANYDTGSSEYYDGSTEKTIKIPRSTSDLTNDSGYITTAILSDYAKKDDIPTDLSDLTDSVGYIKEIKLTGNGNAITTASIDPINKNILILDKNNSFASADHTHATLTWSGYDNGTYNGDVGGNIKIPTTLKNPYTLSWVGYDTGTYDGSAEAEINIPSQISDLEGYDKYAELSVVSGKFDYAVYDDTEKKIIFKSGGENGEIVGRLDATPFIKDGMIDKVDVVNSDIVITFNTAAGKNDIKIPISKIFDSSQYYTKTEIDNSLKECINNIEVEKSGEGNAVTDIKIDSTNKNKLIYTKGTFLTSQDLESYTVPTADNADKLDGYHVADLFSDLTSDGSNISLTIGGETKTLTVGYAKSAGNATTLGGTSLSGIFTDFSNSIKKLSLTIGGTTKTLTPAYAVTAGDADNADKLDGYHATDLFSDLTSDGSNISLTIGGETKTLTVGYAESAGTAKNASSATKLSTAHTINGVSFDGSKDVTGTFTSGLYDGYVEWGGKNRSGEVGPIDAALIPQLGANRFAFLKPAGVTIEYSRDSGVTWTDYGATDQQKQDLFSPWGSGYTIGKASSSNPCNSDCMLRITIKAYNAGVYTELNKFAILLAECGSKDNYCIVEAAKNVGDDYVTLIDRTKMSGWPEWNILNKYFIFGEYSETTARSHYMVLRFTFGCTGMYDGYTSGLSIYKIYAFGGTGWTEPSILARTGVLYSIGQQQEANFPSSIYASKYYGDAALSGTPTAPTAASGTDTTQIATTAFVQSAIPTTLKNPQPLNWVKSSTPGVVDGSYDGSTTETIEIPSKISDLENDENYATTSYVDSQVEKAYIYWEE